MKGKGVGAVMYGERQWAISLHQGRGLTVARFSYESRQNGLQIWDEYPWPLSIGSLTERAILSELYDATLSFWSARE